MDASGLHQDRKSMNMVGGRREYLRGRAKRDEILGEGVAGTRVGGREIQKVRKWGKIWSSFKELLTRDKSPIGGSQTPGKQEAPWPQQGGF